MSDVTAHTSRCNIISYSDFADEAITEGNYALAAVQVAHAQVWATTLLACVTEDNHE